MGFPGYIQLSAVSKQIAQQDSQDLETVWACIEGVCEKVKSTFGLETTNIRNESNGNPMQGIECVSEKLKGMHQTFITRQINWQMGMSAFLGLSTFIECWTTFTILDKFSIENSLYDKKLQEITETLSEVEQRVISLSNDISKAVRGKVTEPPPLFSAPAPSPCSAGSARSLQHTLAPRRRPQRPASQTSLPKTTPCRRVEDAGLFGRGKGWRRNSEPLPLPWEDGQAVNPITVERLLAKLQRAREQLDTAKELLQANKNNVSLRRTAHVIGTVASLVATYRSISEYFMACSAGLNPALTVASAAICGVSAIAHGAMAYQCHKAIAEADALLKKMKAHEESKSPATAEPVATCQQGGNPLVVLGLVILVVAVVWRLFT
ncbi:hypothetical protein Bbelb_199380 [Branchiostoma belcheri]|nr:hypothetical protein Bbelb_199380 [Branchiostoma belcheri]